MVDYVFLLPKSAMYSIAATATANSELISAAQSASDQIMANVNGILPIALGLLGGVLAIGVGIAIFTKLIKKSKSQ